MTTRALIALGTTAALLSGCGDSSLQLVPVSGTVTLNGKPLGDAEIAFLPDRSNKDGQPGKDVTGPLGNYKAMTRGRSGLVPGKYKVKITKAATAAAKVADEFKEDPYMAKLSTEGPDVVTGAKAKKSVSEKIEGEFDGEVPPGGTTLDFDVKASATAAAKETK